MSLYPRKPIELRSSDEDAQRNVVPPTSTEPICRGRLGLAFAKSFEVLLGVIALSAGETLIGQRVGVFGK